MQGNTEPRPARDSLERFDAMEALAQRAAVAIDPIPLHVGQNMARAILLVIAEHQPEATDRGVRCKGDECLWPCPTVEAVARVLA